MYSLKQVSDILYKEGLRTKSGQREGVKVRKARIHKILNCPFYYGVMVRQGVKYQGNHVPLIDKALFDRCQAVLHGHNKPRYKKHSFPFRGLATCAECGCYITAQKQKGHVYYHCTNGKGNCTQKSNYIRQYQLEAQLIHAIFRNTHFNEPLIKAVQQAA